MKILSSKKNGFKNLTKTYLRKMISEKCGLTSKNIFEVGVAKFKKLWKDADNG